MFNIRIETTRRETISERLERERRERARERDARVADAAVDLLGAIFGSSNERTVTVRYTVEEDSVLGLRTSSQTRTESIKLEGGTILGKTTVECTVFGKKVTTMVVEGLDGLNLPLKTITRENDTVFGLNTVTTVSIESAVEAAMSSATNRPTGNVGITIKRAERPRW